MSTAVARLYLAQFLAACMIALGAVIAPLGVFPLWLLVITAVLLALACVILLRAEFRSQRFAQLGQAFRRAAPGR